MAAQVSRGFTPAGPCIAGRFGYTRAMNAKKRPAVVLLGVWDLAWRVWAIRRAIQYKQWRWLVTLLVVNSAGVLPMVYLRRFAKPTGVDGGGLPGFGQGA